MFFFLALLATLGYSVQTSLMVAVYRRMDTLSSVAYRGLSLGVTMLPLLWFVPANAMMRSTEVAGTLLASAGVTALGNWCLANATRYLPVGTASALCMGLAAVVTAGLGYLLFGETLSVSQMLFIGLILIGGVGLGASRAGQAAPPEYRVRLGVFNAVLFALCMGTGFVLMGRAARVLHPFLAGYLWELLIGLVALAAAPLRRLAGRPGLKRISLGELRDIAWRSAPTVLGTGCYALAVSQGPFGVATAVISTGMVLNTVAAVFLYHERLRWVQWALIAAICACTVGLKLTS